VTPRAFIDHMTAMLNAKADSVAAENGSSRDRTIDQYRYQAGVVAGLRQAATAIEDEYKRLLSDDDE
jgi:hypothetical protein